MGKKSPKSPTGLIQKNPRGFAFVISENPKDTDAYIDRRQAANLMTGDRIQFTYIRSKGRLAAKVVKILSRGRSQLIGQVDAIGSQRVVVSEGTQWDLKEKKRLDPGTWVRANIIKYPSKRERGLVELDSILGKTLGPSLDIDLAITEFNLSDDFPHSVRMEIPSRRELANDSLEKERRVDLRDIPLVTIDGADAKDFDDAVAVVHGGADKPFSLYVAIADVSYFVTPGSQLDREATKRATSVYFPGTCLPMLPEALSNDLCSLRPKEERFALTAEIHFDREGKILKSRFYESLIQTHARITYSQLEQFYQRDKKAVEELGHLEKPLKALRSLYKLLNKQRQQRGTLDFELPECKIEVDEEGRPTKIVPTPRYESHKIIEEFMIAANREVARVLRQSKTPSVYRVHEAPDLESLDEINQLLKMLGSSLRLEKASPKEFSKVLASTKKLKGVGSLHSVILRAQKQAHYNESPLGHFGLSLRDYTHFTSPIRRYPDLVVHRSLKQLIAKSKRSDKKSDDGYFSEIARHCSVKERQAVDAERFVNKRKQCWFMEDYVGEIFEAEITWVEEDGLFMQILDFSIEGFLPIDGIDGYYAFDDNTRSLVKGKSRLSVGDRMKIEVEEVSIEKQKIWFRQA